MPSNARGRPKYAYCIPPKLRRQVSDALSDPSITIVSLPFSRLKHICRFEKGGHCKTSPKKMQSRKLPTNPQSQGTKTIFEQFRNGHARFSFLPNTKIKSRRSVSCHRGLEGVDILLLFPIPLLLPRTKSRIMQQLLDQTI
jgi:hypothetical protein